VKNKHALPTSISTTAIIDRHLAALFTELDASASKVETRKKLYAILISMALERAVARLPDNIALIEAIEAALPEIRAKRSAAAAS